MAEKVLRASKAASSVIVLVLRDLVGLASFGVSARLAFNVDVAVPTILRHIHPANTGVVVISTMFTVIDEQIWV